MLEASIVLVSAALIGFQPILMQTLAFCQWHHFAGLVIALALLGFGAAGSTLAVLRGRWEGATGGPSLSLLACGCAMAAALPLLQSRPLRFDLILVFTDPRHAIRFVLGCAVLASPFFFGALSLAMFFSRGVDRIGRLYSANLAGSALGGAVVLAGMHRLSPSALSAACALLPVIAAWLSAPRATRQFVGWAAAGAALAISILLVSPVPLIPSSFKALSRALEIPGSRVLREGRHPLGLAQEVVCPPYRQAPGLSLAWTGAVPRADLVFVNGDLYAEFSEADGDAPIWDYSALTLPFVARRPRNALVLGSGVQAQIVAARSAAVVVEPHPHVAKWFAARCPNAEIAVSDLRAFLERNSRRFDLIHFPVLALPFGAAALQESHLLTKEAMRRALESMTEHGVLVAGALHDYPPRTVPRLAHLCAVALRSIGVRHPQNHILAVATWNTVILAVARRPWDQADIAAARDFCQTRQFDLLWPPSDATTTTVHERGEDVLMELLAQAITGEGAPKLSGYPFRLDSPTDDSPYFYHFLRIGGLRRLRELFGRSMIPYVEMAVYLWGVVFFWTGSLSGLAIFAPLLRIPLTIRGAARPILLFLSLGVGFMLLELVLIQRLSLLLGHAIYSTVLVISGLLCGMAAGSLLVHRIPNTWASLGRTLAAATLLVAVTQLVATSFARFAILWPAPMRVGLALCGLVALGASLGIPFPLSLKLLGTAQKVLVAWAFAINGFGSVIGALLGQGLSAFIGFTAVGAVAVTSYLVALATSGGLWRLSKELRITSC